MSQEILQNIIDDFSPEKFIRFFRDKTRSFAPQQETLAQYNDDSFKDGLKLGEIKFSKTDSLIVNAFKVKQSLSERSGKKAQYEKGKKILKDTQSDAGIFIFYDQHGNFRFSLVYPEAIGARRQWSNFRRFTYFVSREFTNKTYLVRIGDEDFSSLENIKEAFSVEKVTKDFYLAYRKLFEDLVTDLSKNHTFLNQAAKYEMETENFAKKLLGQIVFIYFIQKKGWMGVPAGENWGDGNKNFLVNQFKEAISKKANFFNDYLEPLFYGTLNNPRRNTADPSFSKEFDCRIPFLNGGLFEAEYDWGNSLIYLDNDIFKNIFDVFERFNFTVEEESPDDKEIAVDPEMLGKVFENLLPENLRKGKGTYYTPREIVYYMCQESLINYLDSNSKIGKEKLEKCVKLLKEGDQLISDKEAPEIDKLLETIKICDPACGSGAFLVGMLNEIVRFRLLLRTLHPTKLSKKSECQLKKDAIHNCIYGVDIDPGAIEIAKLRLWLALVVDYGIEEIEPLPNLDYRLMCGNSLVEEFEGVRFYDGDADQEPSLFKDTKKQEKISELKKKVSEYFDVHDDEEKRNKRKEINDIKDWLIKTALENRRKELARHRKSEEAKLNMFDEKSRKKYFSNWGTKFIAEAKINEVLRNIHDSRKSKPFFIWKLEFIDVFEDRNGFDVVIANPPYVRVQNLSHEEIDLYKEKYKSAYKRVDISILFLELSKRIMKKGGVSTYITSSQFTKTEYGRKIRGLLRDDLASIVYFGDNQVFENVVNYTSLFIFTKGLVCKDLLFVNAEKYNGTFRLSDYVRANIKKIDKTLLSEEPWELEQPEIIAVLNKIKNSSNEKLNDLANIEYGLVTGLDKVFVFKKSSMAKLANAPFIFPLITPQNTDRYHMSEPMYCVIYPYKQENEKTILVSEAELKKKSPLVHTYLSDNKKRLLGRKDSRHNLKDSGKIWYGLMRHSSFSKVARQKILTQALCKNNEFCLDRNGYFFTGGSVYSIYSTDKNISNDLLLGLLNSKLCEFYYQMVCPIRQHGYRFYAGEFLKSLPVPKALGNMADSIVKSVDKIHSIVGVPKYSAKSLKQTKVKEYENKIDKIVYDLYNLTDKEIKIIEEFIRK